MPTHLDNLYPLEKKDLVRAAEVLKDAFKDDPLHKAIFQGQSNVDAKLLAFYESPLRFCYRYGKVYGTSEKLEGVAGWVDGDLADMTFWRMLRCGGMRCAMAMGPRLMTKMWPVMKPLSKDRKEHMKGIDFIYLLVIGVSMKHQGQGFGGRLINALIEQSEQSGRALYLETETEPNVRLYEHFGFTMAKKISLPVIHLPMWEMFRK